MLENFIIDGNKVELEVLQKTYIAELLDVTSCSDEWRNYIHSGLRFLKLQIGNNGKIEADLTYQIISEEKGVLILKTLRDR